MTNKIKAALITLSIIGVIALIILAGVYSPVWFAISMLTVCSCAMFYIVYDNVLFTLNNKDKQ